MATIDIGEGQEEISDMEKSMTTAERASLFPRPPQTKEKVRGIQPKPDEKRPTLVYQGNPDLPLEGTLSPLDAIGAPAMLGVRAAPTLLGAIARTMRGPEPAPIPSSAWRDEVNYGPHVLDRWSSPYQTLRQHGASAEEVGDNARRLQHMAELLQKYPGSARSIGETAERYGIGGLANIERYVARSPAQRLGLE